MDKLNQAQTNGVVIGLKDVADVVPRLDVDQLLLQEPDTFNLFLIALGDLQQDPNITDIMSYYQVAGRHQGEPIQMTLMWHSDQAFMDFRRRSGTASTLQGNIRMIWIPMIGPGTVHMGPSSSQPGIAHTWQ
jgi:hypothetical protein